MLWALALLPLLLSGAVALSPASRGAEHVVASGSSTPGYLPVVLWHGERRCHSAVAAATAAAAIACLLPAPLATISPKALPHCGLQAWGTHAVPTTQSVLCAS